MGRRSVRQDSVRENGSCFRLSMRRSRLRCIWGGTAHHQRHPRQGKSQAGKSSHAKRLSRRDGHEGIGLTDASVLGRARVCPRLRCLSTQSHIATVAPERDGLDRLTELTSITCHGALASVLSFPFAPANRSRALVPLRRRSLCSREWPLRVRTSNRPVVRPTRTASFNASAT